MALTATEAAAWWGASIATLVLVWDIVKWTRTGARLRVTVASEREAYGDWPQEVLDKTFVVVEVTNVGDRKTELTHLFGIQYRSWLDRLRGKRAKVFLVQRPALAHQFPCFLQPGERWLGGVTQTPEIEEMARDGLLFVELHHSASNRAILRRVIVEKK